jgi:hypothetical protein
MNGADFELAIRRHVLPALQPLGFELKADGVRSSGRLYSADFTSPHYVVSISFEPGDDYLLVVVFTVKNGMRSNIDDRQATPRLADLNARYLGAEDAEALQASHPDARPLDDEERRVRRVGAELAIVLPRYMRHHRASAGTA